MSDDGGDAACWSHVFDDALVGSFDTATRSGGGDGVVWSLPHAAGLDANVVRLSPGASIADHVNDAVDVLLVVWSGVGELLVGQRRIALEAGTITLVPRGTSRGITARGDGLVYLSTHPARGPMTIGRPHAPDHP
jgi:quercetin dioxygenase-like cupin family protein